MINQFVSLKFSEKIFYRNMKFIAPIEAVTPQLALGKAKARGVIADSGNSSKAIDEKNGS